MARLTWKRADCRDKKDLLIGSAVTLREVLTVKNPADLHGRTSQLTPQETDELVEYLLSL